MVTVDTLLNALPHLSRVNKESDCELLFSIEDL